MKTEDKLIIAGSVIHLLSIAFQVFICIIGIVIGTFSMTNAMLFLTALICAGVWFFLFRDKIPEYKKMFHSIMSKLINDAYKEVKNNIETVTCVGCGKEVTENGYCEENGDAYGDCCWTDHVNDCNKCAELNL